MGYSPSRWSGWHWLLFGALGVGAMALVLVRQMRFGPGLTPDSAAYLSATLGLLSGDGFAPVYGNYKLHAPFFPLALSVVAPIADNVIRVAAIANAAAFGGTVVLTTSWLHRHHAPLWLSCCAGLAVVLSLPLATLAAYVWSEALFILLAVSSLALLDRYLLVGGIGGRRYLIASAICAAMTFATRYMGVAVVASAALVLLVADQGNCKAKAWRALAYTAIAIAPMGLWAARNWFMFGALVSTINPQGFSALASLDAGVTQTLYGVLGPVLFEQLTGMTANAFGGGGGLGLGRLVYKLALLAVCAALFAWAVARRGRAGSLLVPGCFTVVYFALLAVALPLRGLYAEPRYFAVGHISVLLLLALGVHIMQGGDRTTNGARRHSLAGLAVGVGAMFWLAQWINPNRLDIDQWLTRGSDGYGARQWRNSETVALLNKGAALPTGIVLSNDPLALYLLVGAGARGRVHRKCSLGRTCVRRLTNAAKLPQHVSKHRSTGERVHIVWFHRPRLLLAVDLAGLVDALPAMRVVAVLADGIVFRLGVQGTEANVADQLAEAMLRDAGPALPADGWSSSLDSSSRPRYRLHVAGRRLTYVGLDCQRGPTAPRFFLHVTPRSSSMFTHTRPQSFENLDFDFVPGGFVHNGHCLLTAQLPDYPIAEVRTGQWNEDGAIWSARFTPVIESMDR